MTRTSHVAVPVIVALASSACTLLVDAPRHQRAGLDASIDDAMVDDATVDDATVDPIDGSGHLEGDGSEPPPDGETLRDGGEDGGHPCDVDGDGYLSSSDICGGDDCDDTRADVYPFAPPVCGSGRDETCASDRLASALRMEMGIAEMGILPPLTVVAPTISTSREVVGGIAAGDALAPAGAAWVFYRRRGPEAYWPGLARVDLATYEVSDWTVVDDTSVAVHALGGGDYRRDGAFVEAAFTASDPDSPLRAVLYSGMGSGLSASRYEFETPPSARLAAAVVGTSAGLLGVVLAAQNRREGADHFSLVFRPWDNMDVVEVPVASASLGAVHGEGVGPYAYFSGIQVIGASSNLAVWDLSGRACSATAECEPGTTCHLGRCIGLPVEVRIEDSPFFGDLDLSYVPSASGSGGALWYVSSRGTDVDVGTLSCDATACSGARSATLSFGAYTTAPRIDAFGSDTLVVASATSEGVRVALFRPSTNRQLKLFDDSFTWTLAVPDGPTASMHASTLITTAATTGTTRTLLLALVNESGDSRVWITGLRACEEP